MTPGMSWTTASRRPRMRFTSVDLPTFGPPDHGDAPAAVRTPPRSPRRHPSVADLPVAFVDSRCRRTRRASVIAALPCCSLATRSSNAADHLGFGHVAGVDQHGVVGRPQRRHRPRRVEVVATLHVGQHGLVVVASPVGDVLLVAPCARVPRPRRSGRSSRRRPAARRCRCRGPRPRRCRARGQLALQPPPGGSRTAGTADTAETALVTASPRISPDTSSPSR